MKVTFSASQNTIIFSLLILIGNVQISLCDIPTVVDAKPFDDKIKAACITVLHDALQNGKKEHDVVIDILTSVTFNQRQELRTMYQKKYQTDLIKDIKSTFSGDVEEMMVDLFKSPIEILAEFMYSSMKGIGTNEINLITGLILTVKSEDVRQKVETVFYEQYKKELLDMVKDDTSRSFKTALIKILQCNMPADDKKVDIDSAKKDARILYEEKNEIEKTAAILFSTPPNRLKEILKQLQLLCKEDADAYLGKKYSGHVGDLFKQRASFVMNEAKYAADRFQLAVKGSGTNEKMIIVLTLIMCEKNLGDVINTYNKIYKNSIQNRMAEDISGELLQIFKEICGSKETLKGIPPPKDLQDIPQVRQAISK